MISVLHASQPQATHLTRFLGPAAWLSVHGSFAGLLSLPLCFPGCLQTLRLYGCKEPAADLLAHTSSSLLLKILRQAGKFLPKEPSHGASFNKVPISS